MKIVIAPDEVLSQVATPVEKVHDKLVRTMYDMLDLMYDLNGIGLAAPQIGVSRRFFVMHLDHMDEKPHFFINPVIIAKSEKMCDYEEGCLSLPGESILITRPSEITLEYLDIDGKKNRQDFGGLHATCAQHEIDHLNGIVIADHIMDMAEKTATLQRTRQIKNTR